MFVFSVVLFTCFVESRTVGVYLSLLCVSVCSPYTLVPVKTWHGETCNIWWCERPTLPTCSPMTGELTGLGAKVRHLLPVSPLLSAHLTLLWVSLMRAAWYWTRRFCESLQRLAIGAGRVKMLCSHQPGIHVSVLSRSPQLVIHMDMVSLMPVAS